MMNMSRRSASTMIMISVLLLAPLTLTTGEQAANGLEMIIEIEEPANNLYHSSNSPLELTVKIQNHGDVVREMEYNPACPFDLIISNNEWEWNLDDTRICPEQRRAFAIQPGQTRVLDTWGWDWDDVPSGVMTLEFEQPQSQLVAITNLNYHKAMDMPENLQLNSILGETIGTQIGHTNEMPAMIKISLSNKGTLPLEIPFDSNCAIEMNIDETYKRITDISCGTGILQPGNDIELGWVDWDFDGSSEGLHSIEFGMTGIRNAASTINTQLTYNPGKLSTNSLIPTVTADISNSMTWYFSLENTDDIRSKLHVETSCTTQMHVISPKGEIIYNTREILDCTSSGIEFTIPPRDSYVLSAGTWDLLDQFGCELENGLHLLVVSQPEYGLVANYPFNYSGNETGALCKTANQDMSDVYFSVNDLQVINPDTSNEHLTFDINLQNLGEDEFEIYWPTTCALEMTLSLVAEDTQEIRRVWNEGCSDVLVGQTMLLDDSSSHQWGGIDVPFTENDEPLEDGNWVITIKTNSIPELSTVAAHKYDGFHNSDVTIAPDQEIVEVIDDNTEVDLLSPVITIVGNWHYVTTSNQGCWLITDNLGKEWVLISNVHDGGWSPHPGMSGTYQIEQVDSLGDCSTWDGVVILNTITEQSIQISPEILSPSPSNSVETPSELIVENAPTAAAVVATTSLSIMILLYVGNTEWIRIPALQIGMGMMGMIKRSREHDGDYQRGRIMGYLAANPGVHFRALLGALGMSNGQLTHHLKNLQNNEQIWRRKDGRLVRFYPASIQQTLQEEELPVPLLTPDSNSLQGKILRLLDATENDIVNLSQKELAVRLEASQQLISHHLRTLQKFGLIEREKIGMRYRYQLTREAIFLVNSTEYDIDVE